MHYLDTTRFHCEIFFCEELFEKYAPAGNRTRVTSMATMYSTTEPLALLYLAIFEFYVSVYYCFNIQDSRYSPNFESRFKIRDLLVTGYSTFEEGLKLKRCEW